MESSISDIATLEWFVGGEKEKLPSERKRKQSEIVPVLNVTGMDGRLFGT